MAFIIVLLLLNTPIYMVHSKLRYLIILDYGALVSKHRLIPLKDFPLLKISQEYHCKNLIATGQLSKDAIELPLEDLLKRKLNRDVDVDAEDLPGTADTWKITTESEGKQSNSPRSAINLFVCYF